MTTSLSRAIAVTPALIASGLMSWGNKGVNEIAICRLDVSALSPVRFSYLPPPDLAVAKLTDTTTALVLMIMGGRPVLYTFAFTIECNNGEIVHFPVTLSVFAESPTTSPVPSLLLTSDSASVTADSIRYVVA